MLDKQIYDLTVNDIYCWGVWYFPMDESVKDEATVRPLDDADGCADFQLIVRTKFEGVNGEQYIGYLYWSGFPEVKFLKPVVLLDDGSAVSFWSGIRKPSWNGYSGKAKSVSEALPLKFTSEPLLGLAEISGVLDGLYYLDNRVVSCV